MDTSSEMQRWRTCYNIHNLHKYIHARHKKTRILFAIYGSNLVRNSVRINEEIEGLGMCQAQSCVYFSVMEIDFPKFTRSVDMMHLTKLPPDIVLQEGRYKYHGSIEIDFSVFYARKEGWIGMENKEHTDKQGNTKKIKLISDKLNYYSRGC